MIWVCDKLRITELVSCSLSVHIEAFCWALWVRKCNNNEEDVEDDIYDEEAEESCEEDKGYDYAGIVDLQDYTVLFCNTSFLLLLTLSDGKIVLEAGMCKWCERLKLFDYTNETLPELELRLKLIFIIFFFLVCMYMKKNF